MVPKIMQSTPMEPKGVSVLASASTPRLIRMIPTTKSKAPLLRMRALVARSFFLRALWLWLGSSQRGPSATEASHRGHTSRGFTTDIPHCGHLRVRAIRAKNKRNLGRPPTTHSFRKSKSYSQSGMKFALFFLASWFADRDVVSKSGC